MISIPVVAALIVRGERILIAKRRSLPFGWEFPGGKVEANESLEEALVREIKEELSVTIRVGDHIGQSTVLVAQDRQVVMDLFVCELIVGEPNNQEHEELRWIVPQELRNWEWAPADIPLLPQIETFFGVRYE